jgi:hypothetical protein
VFGSVAERSDLGLNEDNVDELIHYTKDESRDDRTIWSLAADGTAKHTKST